MPRIKEIYSEQSVQGPIVDRRRASGADFGGGIGAASADLGKEVFNAGIVAYKIKEQEETSDLHAKLSETHAAFTNELHDQVNKGKLNQEEYMQKLDDHFSKLGESVGTRGARLYFQKQSAELRRHFNESAIAGQAELAGSKARENYVVARNSLSNSLLVDPTGYQSAVAMHEAALDTMVEAGNLPATAAAKLKTEGRAEIAQAAVRGWAKLNPDAAKKQVESGKWDSEFTSDTKFGLLREIDAQKHAKEVDQKKKEIDLMDAKQARIVAFQNEFLQRVQDGKATAQEVLDNPDLDPVEGAGSKRALISLIAKESTAKSKDNPAVLNATLKRIHLPDGDPKKISNEEDLIALVGNGLSFASMKKLRGEIQGNGTAQGKIEAELKSRLFKIAEAELVKKDALGLPDPDGERHMSQFVDDALTQLSDAKNSGKSTRELLDPDSPTYLGKSISQYRRSSQEVIRSMTDRIRSNPQTPTPAPLPPEKQRLPGESAADYLKRTGG